MSLWGRKAQKRLMLLDLMEPLLKGRSMPLIYLMVVALEDIAGVIIMEIVQVVAAPELLPKEKRRQAKVKVKT